MKTAIIIIAVIVLAGGAGFVIFNNQEPEGDRASEQAVSQDETASEMQSQPEEPSENPDPNNYASSANVGETLDAADRQEVTISVDDFIFETTYLKIKSGTKVTWINNGNTQHDVTSASTSPNGGLGSELLGNGDTYEFTFTETGVYEYFCTPHPVQMRGVITVVN